MQPQREGLEDGGLKEAESLPFKDLYFHLFFFFYYAEHIRSQIQVSDAFFTLFAGMKQHLPIPASVLLRLSFFFDKKSDFFFFFLSHLHLRTLSEFFISREVL